VTSDGSKGSPEGFAYDDATGLFRRSSAAGPAYADGGEDYVAEVISAQSPVSGYPVELAPFIRDWPSRYHLSHQRTNLLDSIGELLDPAWSVLELGAGPGALTRWLADRVAHVDAVEGSEPRARINRARNAGRDNVRVFLDDVRGMPFPSSYDAVTLIGVLEYIADSVQAREACVDALARIRACLNPGGVLILAIENELGLKYWAGCREEHTGKAFDSVAGYPSGGPRTFTRGELEGMLDDAGFARTSFYHCFPDYKLPAVVIRESEEALAASPHHWFRATADDWTGRRLSLFPEPLALEQLVSEGLLWRFSNSFMVVAGADTGSRVDTDWLIKKYWNAARPELHHTVTLRRNGADLLVERAPMAAGRPDVDLDGGITFRLRTRPYVAGELMAYDAYRAFVADDATERVGDLIASLVDFLMREHGKGATDEQGFPLVAGEALDFAFWNIVRKPDGALEVIDDKWAATEPIPADYVVFRNLYWLYCALSPFAKTESAFAFTLDVISRIWPQSDGDRVLAHARREAAFQAMVAGRDEDAPDAAVPDIVGGPSFFGHPSAGETWAGGSPAAAAAEIDRLNEALTMHHETAAAQIQRMSEELARPASVRLARKLREFLKPRRSGG
jgi:O-antigen biosynthesis protein